MNKNGQLYSSANEGHSKTARYKRLLLAQKGTVDTCLGSGNIIRTKSNIFDESIPNDPTPVLQRTPWKPSNITTKVKQSIKQKIKDFGE